MTTAQPTVCRNCLKKIQDGEQAILIIGPVRMPYSLFNDIVGKETYIHVTCLNKVYPDIAKLQNCYLDKGIIVLQQVKKLIKNVNEESLSRAIGTVGFDDIGAIIKEYYRITAPTDRTDRSSAKAADG